MSAPSFSSFPPSFASFPDIDTGSQEQVEHKGQPSQDGHAHRRQDKDERRKHKDKDKDKKRKRAKDERQHKRSKHQTDDILMKAVEPSNSLLYSGDETWRQFYSDRRGDMLNIQFGGLHVGHVPKYNLVDGGRSILGLSSAWTARRNGKGVTVELRGQRKLRGLTDSGVRTLLAAEPKRRLLASGDVYKYKEVDGFLPLPSHRTHNNDQAYRSITKSKPESDFDSTSDSERESDSDESSRDEPTLSSRQESLKLLEQQLASNPTSVKLWLSLLTQTLSTVPLLSKNAAKARAEISLSVLSRAMSADPANTKSKMLRIKYLKAGEEVWQENKSQDEWEDALKVGGIEIWMEWLEWRIRRGRKGIDGALQDVVRAMEAFDSDLMGEMAKLRIFWRVAVAFQQAGYTERSMAFFQAQAELTFKTPRDSQNTSLDPLLDSLEEFWESEVPRIGEPGSRGWAAWVASGEKQGDAPLSAPVQNTTLELDPYRQWAANELNADRRSILSIRSTDEHADPDPYSTVLFADVRPLLFTIRTLEGKDAFRLIWLSFLGLSTPGFLKSVSHREVDELEADWDDRWSFTHLCKPSYLKAIFPEEHELHQREADAIAGALVGREKEYGSTFGPVKNWACGVLGPLHGINVRTTEKGKRKEKRYAMWGTEDFEGVHADLVRRIFTQLSIEGEDVNWKNLALAFEAGFGVKNALKLSRQFLSTTQTSLYCWASHAQLERMRGRLDDARKVYHTVLIASSPSAQDGKAQMWWDWAEMEWLSSRREEALGITIRSTGVEGKGGLAVLRAKRSLEDAVKTNNKWKEREGWIKLRALLELLTTGDAKAALESFDSCPVEAGSGEHESLVVASLLMAYYHFVMLQNPMPPSLLRERARRAIETYPSNSIILGLFLEGEKGQGVWGQIRASVGESGGRSKDVVRRVEEVWLATWDMGRWMNEIERTRSGLSAAVEHERTRASPIIWRVYIEFEIQAKELERAKKLLYRAIAECPLVKELYLLAFGALRRVFDKGELGNFADTMAERGIRMRQGLDEILEGWTIEAEREEEDNDEPIDEIEENARELRRLRPY